jgi:broad specificity phosphatase PhoE
MKVLLLRHAQSQNNVVQANIQRRLEVGATGLQQAQV